MQRSTVTLHFVWLEWRLAICCALVRRSDVWNSSATLRRGRLNWAQQHGMEDAPVVKVLAPPPAELWAAAVKPGD